MLYTIGSAYGSHRHPKLTFRQGVHLRTGTNKISLLSIVVGLPNVGRHFERWDARVLGPVTLNGLDEGKRDPSWQKWSYKLSTNLQPGEHYGTIAHLYSTDRKAIK